MVKADRSTARNALTTRSEPYNEKAIHAELANDLHRLRNTVSSIGSK
jgi:hypothetical protein